MESTTGTFLTSYGPSGGGHMVQYGDVVTSSCEDPKTTRMSMEIQVMNEAALLDLYLERTAKLHATKWCVDKLLEWAGDSGYRIRWFDQVNGERTRLPLETTTHQNPISVAVTLTNADWLQDAVVDAESWMRHYREGGVTYGLTAELANTLQTPSNPSRARSVVETVDIEVNFREGEGGASRPYIHM